LCRFFKADAEQDRDPRDVKDVPLIACGLPMCDVEVSQIFKRQRTCHECSSPVEVDRRKRDLLQADRAGLVRSPFSRVKVLAISRPLAGLNDSDSAGDEATDTGD
jgi:hypothetical protein